MGARADRKRAAQRLALALRRNGEGLYDGAISYEEHGARNRETWDCARKYGLADVVTRLVTSAAWKARKG